MFEEPESLDHLVQRIARQAREASYGVAVAKTEHKNAVLSRLATLIESSAEDLGAANEKDLAVGREQGLSKALLDRLALTPERIASMAEGVRQVASLPDPVGTEIGQLKPDSGIDIRKVRVPIGVVGIIYESRPNVTVDCAALCLKSGNACILRGGREAFHSNQALAALVRQALEEEGMDSNAVQLIPTTDRTALGFLLKQDQYVHCIVPRGGEGLIRYVVENSNIPVIKHFEGICSLYLDSEADLQMAREIAVNAKCQRPGVCNAIENLVVHRSFAAAHLAEIAQALANEGVELRADVEAGAILHRAGIGYRTAAEEDWSTEYLDLILSIRVVSSADEAISFINRYGSQHSDSIITTNEATARRFLRAVDSSTVYWNASTRFTDGYEFGLGAEIGISTDRLHARGPMGLEELCTYKYEVHGKGEVRK
ncbi:glutamate-5-semialdehyde dehydrogenase [Puniceicoccus vermicola]|uniref:Gamma-glutamyl phosphate reductase n=1 Tax=Puniceicoccus vermicola TaxID=388746 RepID=A0A7X1AZI7_9BACT|nr:glutamate-5-semialdehyde dehydrogenase [Puniceicoccus vermicola]MBC2602860.1 glutamate-5-semialdehyde dehydrogenase [Puniceicoccus vermicola]